MNALLDSRLLRIEGSSGCAVPELSPSSVTDASSLCGTGFLDPIERLQAKAPADPEKVHEFRASRYLSLALSHEHVDIGVADAQHGSVCPRFVVGFALEEVRGGDPAGWVEYLETIVRHSPQRQGTMESPVPMGVEMGP
jgi:hypothetical protein